MDAQRRLAIIFLLFAFPVVWLLSMWLTAQLSGWARLAELYRLSGEFDGRIWEWQTGYMRFYCHYGNVLIAGADSQGLYLSLFKLFRVGHPPLFIPWRDITVGRVWWWTELRFPRADSVPLRIGPKLTKHLVDAAGPSWPGQDAQTPLG